MNQPGMQGGYTPMNQPGMQGGYTPMNQPGMQGGYTPMGQPGMQGGYASMNQPGVQPGNMPEKQPKQKKKIDKKKIIIPIVSVAVVAIAVIAVWLIFCAGKLTKRTAQKTLEDYAMQIERKDVKSVLYRTVPKNLLVRLLDDYGDGYDFFVETEKNEFLCEIKGIALDSGGVRLTQNEFEKAREFKESYLLVAVMNLQLNPQFKSILNPLENLDFAEKIITPKSVREYHLVGGLSL